MSPIFITIFLVFFHFSPDFYHCFFGVFTVDYICSCHQPSLYPDCFLLLSCQVLHFCVIVPECYRFERTFFLLSGVFYLILLPETWYLLLSRLPWELTVLPWRLQGLPLRFGIQTRPICLFELHSVQQKVLFSRFYLYVKALRNTISTSSRFWTHSLIVICIVKHMLYPLGHRGS